MKLKNILILILCIVLCPPIVMAVSDNTVYTEFTGGNSSSTGNGTEQSPYNLFEDALNAVEDGGTICVGEKGAFVNSSDDKPLVINKNVTITSKSDTALEISIRKAGVVLGGNVSFKNVVLSLVNGNHALIAANGYTLTLDNVTYFQNTREVHIVGGTLYDKNGVSLSPTVGEKSKIVLSGNKTHFGNIYAGSINGSFDKDVEIDINDVTGKNIGKVYSCGAKEGYYNSDNFLDPNNEPTAPTADSAVYGVTGNVDINLSNSSICEIDGDCGSGRANVSVVTEYQYSSAMKNIGLLTVDSGMLELTEINDDVNVKINSNGILDMSNLGECSVNDFYGGGTLVLAKDGLLTVNGTLSGVTEFQTSGGVNSSGIAEYDRLYIKTSKGDGSFTFNPYATQSDMTLDKTVDGFKTSSKTEEDVVLKSFEITGSEFKDTSFTVNQSYFDIPIETEFESSGFCDISMVPLVYTVSYNGETYGPRNSTVTEDGNYEGDFAELNMCFAPITDNISVSKHSSTIGYMDDIAEGVYDVTVTAPTASGNVERSFKLIVGDVTPTATPTAVVPTPTATPEQGEAVKDITIDMTKVGDTEFSSSPATINFSSQLDARFDLAYFKEVKIGYELTFEGEDTSKLTAGKIAVAGTTEQLTGFDDGVAFNYNMAAGATSVSVAFDEKVTGPAVGLNIQPMDAAASYGWPETLKSVKITSIVFVARAGATYPAAGASKPTPKPTVAPEFESSEFKYDGLDQN